VQLLTRGNHCRSTNRRTYARNWEHVHGGKLSDHCKPRSLVTTAVCCWCLASSCTVDITSTNLSHMWHFYDIAPKSIRRRIRYVTPFCDSLH